MASVIDSLCVFVNELLSTLEKAKGNVFTIRRDLLHRYNGSRRLWNRLVKMIGEDKFANTLYMVLEDGYVVYTARFKDLLQKFASEHCHVG